MALKRPFDLDAFHGAAFNGRDYPSSKLDGKDMAVLQGDPRITSSVVRIWENERSRLRKLARRWVNGSYASKSDPSDIVQETYLDAYCASRVPPRGSDYRRWLTRILWRNCLSFVKRFRRERRDVGKERSFDAGPCDVRASIEVSLLDAMIRAEREAELRRALLRLTDEERHVLTLRANDGLSFHEIGAHLGKSEDAARMQWCRAVLALKKKLDRSS